jgi:hypothetical protein
MLPEIPALNKTLGHKIEAVFIVRPFGHCQTNK